MIHLKDFPVNNYTSRTPWLKKGTGNGPRAISSTSHVHAGLAARSQDWPWPWPWTVIRGLACGRRRVSGGGCGCGVSLGAGDDFAGAHDGKADEVQVHCLSGGPILAVRPHTHAAHFRNAVTGPFWVVTLGARLVAVGRGTEKSANDCWWELRSNY